MSKNKNYSSVRPHHGPRQVRTKDGLIIGKVYRRIKNGEFDSFVRIDKAPDLWNKEMWVSCTVRFSKNGKELPMKIRLVDLGIAQTRWGKWHKHSHLLRL